MSNVRIERVEDWVGQGVVGPDGEKIGRLEDIVFSAEGDALLGAVSTGLFGRRTSLIPLDGATVAPGHVAVPYTKSQVKSAPQLDDPAAMTAAVEDETEIHYGLPERARREDERYVTAAERTRQAEEAAEAARRAAELEQRADTLGASTDSAQQEAAAAQERADALERERADVEAKAQAAREQQARLEP